LNERIKKLRKELDMTQQKFGACIGIKGNTVAQWESGRNEPPDSAITFICKEYNVNEEWLRTGTGEMFNPSPTSALDALAAEFHLDKASYVAIEKFLELSPEMREGLITYCKKVADALAEDDIPDNISDAEALYEKSLGIAPNSERTASNIIDDTENVG
jgi:transcriptional regulator with XRE-family HTH domain